MPTYQIKAPDGKTYRIEGPPGASQQDVVAAVLRANPTAGVASQPKPQVTYQTKAPDGKTYQIQGPAGASPDEINAAVARQAPTSTKPEAIRPPTKTEAAEAAEQVKMLNENAASLNRMIAEQQRLAKLPGATASMREKSEATIGEYRKTIDDIKTELDYIKRTGRVVPERSFGEAALDQLKGLGASALRTFAGVPSLLGETIGKASEEWAEGVIKRNLAPDDSEAAQYSTMAKQARKLSEVAGSVGPALITRGASRLGMAALGERAVPALARAEQAAQLALGAGPGAQQQRQAIEQYEQKTGTEVNPVVRTLAQVLGAAIGATEVLTLDAMMARVPSSLRGSMTAKIANLAERVNVGGMSPKAAAAEVRTLMTDIQRTGRGRIGVAMAEEGVQEGTAQFAQNVVEKTTYNPDKDVTEGVAENFIYGSIVGGGVRGLTEMVRKVTGNANLAKKVASDQALIDATMRLQDNPQDDEAFDIVTKRMTEAYGFTPEQAARYAEQTLGRARGEENVPSTVAGGTGPGVPDIVDAGVPGGDAGTAGPTGPGGLGDVGTAAGPDIGVEGAQQRPLKKPTAKQVKAALPTVEQAFADAAIDFEENYGVTELTGAQKQVAARMVVEGVDAYDAIDNLLQKQERAPTSTTKVEGPPNAQEIQDKLTAKLEAINAKHAEARAAVAAQVAAVQAQIDAMLAPSLDQQAVEPVANAIETATTPTPGAVVPGIAETAAKETGLLPAPATVEETVTEAVPEEPAKVTSLTDTRNGRIMDTVRQVAANPNASMDEIGNAIEALDDVYSSGDIALANEAAQLQDQLRNVERARQEAARPSNENVEETPLERAEREAIEAEDRYVNATFKTQDPRAEMDRRTKERKTYDVEVAALEQDYRSKMAAAEALRSQPAPAAEEAPVAEQVAPEVDPYEDLLMEVDDALANDEIDKKAHNLLKFAATTRKASPEDILNKLEESRTSYAEQAMRYKRGPSAGSLSKDAVSAHVRKLVANWGAKLNIQVVDSLEELPPTLQDAIFEDDAADAYGFVSPDGTIYILAQNLDSLGDATATIYHESLGHFGLRALFNERLDKVLREIYRTNKALRDEVGTWLKENPKAYADKPNRELRALEEILAERSEAGRIEASIWAKIGAVIKDFGRRMGLSLDFSENEVRAILAMAHDQIVNGPRESSKVQGLRYMVGSLWQGGPTDHDKHDSGFLGSGSGSAAYGWGHYFSTMREVAEHYRKITGQRGFSSGDTISDRILDYFGLGSSEYPNGMEFRTFSRFIDIMERGLRAGMNAKELTAFALENAKTIDKSRWDSDRGVGDKVRELAKDKGLMEALAKPYGRLFEVNLKPNEDQFLDWDKPFEEQSERVKDALKTINAIEVAVDRDRQIEFITKLVTDMDNLAMQMQDRIDYLEEIGDNYLTDREYLDMEFRYDKLDAVYAEAVADLDKPITGEMMYKQLEIELGSDKAASEALLLAGIRGTTYMGDRRVVGGAGARNYVVFGDSDITIVNKYARKKGTPKAKVTEGEEDINRGVAQAQMAADALEAADGIGAAINGHDKGFFYPAIKEGWTSFNDATREGMLGALSSSFIVNDLDNNKIPSLRRLKTLESKIRGSQNKLRNNFGKLDRAFTRFVNRKGQRVLGMTMHTARINEFSPVEYASLDEALQQDGMKKWYEDRMKDPNLSKGQRAAYKGRVTYREKQIRAVWKLWEELGQQPGGREIYIRVRNFYADMYAVMRSEQNQYIKGLPIDAEAKKELLAAVDPDNYAEEADDNDPHEGVPENVRPKEYFPFRRYGKYWLTVKGKGIKTGRERHHFESAFARNAFMRKRAKELGVDLETDTEVFDKGNSLEEYQNNMVESSLMLSKLFATIDKAVMSGNYDTSKYATADEALAAMKKDLKDRLYQTYLMTLPERSLRRQFIHAEKVTGFSGDVLRNFRTSSTQYAVQIPKLQLGSDVNNTISAAYDAMDGMPVDERARARTYVDEIVRRTRDAINPEEPSAWIAALSRFSFYEVMTSVASAVSQMASIPLSVMPKLNADYGYTASAAAFMRYSFIPYSFGIPERDADGGYSQVLPSVGTSLAVKNNPVRKRAFEELNSRDIFDASSASSMLLRNNMAHDYSTYNIPAEVLGLAAKAMRLPFTMFDMASREISAMMFFDLDYEKNLKDGMKPNEAFDTAIENTVKGIDETIGSHNQFERPRYMVGNIRQLFFLFRMYAVNRTMFGLRMGSQIIRGENATGRTRAAAIHELTGTLAMVGLFAGTAGLPLLDVICGAIDMILPSLMDDEEEEEFRRQHPYSYNDSKQRFLYEWLPQHFGQQTLPGLDGKPHALADVLRNGVPSELIGANFASRLGWNGMWIRDSLPGEDLKDTIINFLETNLVPGAAISFEFIKALEDMYKGDVQRGLEKVVPGMFRGSITAERLEKEGAETRKGVKMFTKDELTALQRNFQRLGWAPNEVSDWQRERMGMLSMVNAATQERSDLMANLNKAKSDPEGSPETVAEVEANIREFNRLHPLPELQIEKEDTEKSRKRYLQGELESYRGTQLSPEQKAVFLRYK